MSSPHRGTIAVLKARQQELKKFYAVVGKQQAEVLDLLAQRDLGRLVRRARAHQKVREWEESVEELKERCEDAKDLFRKRYDMEVESANRQYELEKEAIEIRYKVRFRDAHPSAHDTHAVNRTVSRRPKRSIS
jgi:hypothetical protein